MAQDLTDRVRIRQYLLGELTPEERERVEERLLTEDDYFAEFQLLKEELIDQYAEGVIAGRERERFERHFLTTPDRHLSLRLAQALSAYPAPSSEQTRAKKVAPARPLFAWARALSARPLLAACLLAVAAISIIVWYVVSRRPSAVAEGLLALGEAYRIERPV